MKKNFILASVLSVFFLASCSVQKSKPVAYQNIVELVNNSAILKQHHVGFVLKEIGAEHAMVQKNADKYFIPASNIKLLTFYTSLNLLGDSIPSIQYTIRKDSLFIWSMADPSFLHPSFNNHRGFNFIKNSGKKIFLINGRYKGEKFGKGWSWDDFDSYYQAELTGFPLYGNMLNITNDGFGKLKCYPDLSAMYLSDISTSADLLDVKRGLDNNNLTMPKRFDKGFSQAVPLHFDASITENLLTDTLLATGLIIKPVETLPWRKVPINAKIIYSVKADSLYKIMLQQSDNFIAEQLLLNCAAANQLTMHTDSVISLANKKLFADLPDKLQWVDGSGLSRQNLVTPRDMAMILQKLYDKVGDEKRLFSLLPSGGKSGTLKNMLKSNDAPFVFAKTGSLNNNYNISGYLIGASGKKYLFSFMNNNYVATTTTVKAEVERILMFVRENY